MAQFVAKRWHSLREISNMYNADYRIYTIDQIADVLLGKFADPTFAILVEEEESETFLHVKYPFFKKPKYVVFDSLDDDEAL